MLQCIVRNLKYDSQTTLNPGNRDFVTRTSTELSRKIGIETEFVEI
jgi:hypothetical protein